MAINSVAASEIADADDLIGSQNSTDLIMDNNDKEIVTANDEEVLADSANTFSQLQSIIDGNESGSTIYLDNDYVSSGFSSEGIVINKDITIDGQGHKLNGENSSRIFYINASNVVLKNMVFVNSNSSNVGSVIYSDQANLTLDNCKFTDIVCEDSIIYSTDGSLAIENSEFSDMSLIDGLDGEIESFIHVFNGDSIENVFKINSVIMNNIAVVPYVEYGEGATDYIFGRSPVIPIFVEGNNNTLVSINDASISNVCFSALASLNNVNNVDIRDFSANGLENFVAYDDIMYIGSLYINSKGNVSLENIVIGDLTIREYMEIYQMDDDFGGMLNLQYGGPSIYISAENGWVSLKNINITNTESAGHGSYNPNLIHVDSNESIVLDNVNIVNLSEKTKFYAQYDNDLNEFIYNNCSGETTNSIELISSTGNVSLSNLNVDSIVSSGEFILINGYDISVENVSVKNSPMLGGGEGILVYVYAQNNAIIDNMVCDNLTRTPGANQTSYMHDYLKYIYSYSELYGEGSLGISLKAVNTNLTNIAFTNSEGGGANYMFTVEANNIIADNILVENITMPYYYSLEYNPELGEYIMNDISRFDEKVGFYFSSQGYANITNIYVNNTASSYDREVFMVMSENITLENISILNSKIPSSSPITIKAGNLFMKNMVLDNLSLGYGGNYTYFNQDLGKYIWDASNPYGEIGVTIQAANASIYDFSMTDIFDASSNLFNLNSETNVLMDNVTFENIVPVESIQWSYDRGLKDYVYFNKQFRSGSVKVTVVAENNVSISNIGIADLMSNEGFLDIGGDNVTIVNASFSDLQVSGGVSACQIMANGRLNVDNFNIVNVSSDIGLNMSSYDVTYRRYISQIDSSGTGFGVSLNGDDVSLTGFTMANVSNADERILYLTSSGNVSMDNVCFENIAPFKTVTGEYHPEFNDYRYTSNYASGNTKLHIEGDMIINISNLEIVNFTSNSDFLLIDARDNVSLENVSVDDLSCSGPSSCMIVSDSGKLTVNNFTITNVSKGIGNNQTEYSQDYDEYFYAYQSLDDGFSVVLKGYGVRLSDFSMVNVTDAGKDLFALDACGNNISIDNVLFENITPSERVTCYYDYTWEKYIYDIISEGVTKLRIFNADDINISNVKIVNFTSNKEFLTIDGINLTLNNFSVENSSLGGDECCMIYAEKCLTINNFTANNIHPGPGTNYTSYSYGKHVYDYYSVERGFSLKLHSNENITASNLSLTNIQGGGIDAILKIDYGWNHANYIELDEVLIENITSFNSVHIAYDPDLVRHICLENNSVSAGAGIYACSSGGVSKLYNVKINNIYTFGESSNALFVHNNDMIIENVSVTNVSLDYYVESTYDKQHNRYDVSMGTEIEGFIFIDASQNLNITNLLVDSVPCSENPLVISGGNVTIYNSTFRNVYSELKGYQTDENGQLVETEFTNCGRFLDIIGDNVLVFNTEFKNITVGASKDYYGVLLVSANDVALLKNCTFRDITSQSLIESGWYGNDCEDSYGGTLRIDDGKLVTNIVECKFINCSSDYGGAIYAIVPLNITGSQFINCSAKQGGAIYVGNSGLFVNDTLFESNKAIMGGAVFFTNESFNNTFYNVTFLKNLAYNNGGALYIFESGEDGVNLINASTFYLNHANYNGGAFFFNDTQNRFVWEDYRWHNATASSRIHDDLTFISNPLKRTMILFSEFEDNTDYSLNITAHNNAAGGNITVTITIDEVATGYVYVNITDKNGNFIKDKQGRPINGQYLIENGRVLLELEDLPIGEYNVSANYSNWEYDNVLYYHVNSTIFSVYSHDLNVTANKTIYADENLTVIAKLNNMTTGTVNITVSNENYTLEFTNIAVDNGTVIYNIGGLYAGEYNVTVTYNGDDSFYPKSNSTLSTVVKRDSTVDVKVEGNVYGNVTKIIVEVPKNQTGNVTVKINNLNITREVTNGTAVFEIANLTAGPWQANVTFEENRVYRQNTTIFSFNVAKANLTANVTANNVTVKENASFVLDYPEDFAGNVSISINGQKYYDGPASNLINITKLPAGNYAADIRFYGDDNYNDNETAAEFNVKPVEPEMTVNITDAVYGGNATATIKVSNNANGTVIITVDGKNYTVDVENGQATMELDNLSSGFKHADAKFISSDRYNSNTTAASNFTVAKANSTIVISGNGTDVILTLPVNATGNVTCYVNGKRYHEEIKNGKVILTDALTIGNNTVAAFYRGDANYGPSRNETVLEVNKSSSAVNATVVEVVYGNDAIMVVNVEDNQTGFVTITINDKEYSAKIKKGKAVFNITGLNVGNYTVDVVYEGDDSYFPNSNLTSVHVIKANLTATAIALNVTELQNSSFAINVPDDFAGKVSITVDGISYSGDAKSLICMPRLAEGDKMATVKFFGDKNYNDLELNASFKVSPLDHVIEILSIKSDNMTRGYNSPYDYQAAFLDADGEALKNATVIFKVNGKEYKATTNDDGIAQLTGAKLAVGKYNITSFNPVTGEEAVNELEIIKRITENRDLVMEYRDGSVFKVKVWGDDGELAPEGEIIDITANGVHYVAKVDKNGYAHLKITLLPKKYTITAEYKGFKTSNKLTVKQILKPVKKTTTIKKSKKSFKLKATLKYSSGKVLKGKVIAFKIKGKTLKAKTNKKGVATVTVKKNIIKKLKKGKKYTVTVSYTVKDKFGNGYVKIVDKVKCYVKIKK